VRHKTKLEGPCAKIAAAPNPKARADQLLKQFGRKDLTVPGIVWANDMADIKDAGPIDPVWYDRLQAARAAVAAGTWTRLEHDELMKLVRTYRPKLNDVEMKAYFEERHGPKVDVLPEWVPPDYEAEASDDYPYAERLGEGVRITWCSDDRQWIVQHRAGPGRWDSIAYCMTKGEFRRYLPEHLLGGFPDHYQRGTRVLAAITGQREWGGEIPHISRPESPHVPTGTAASVHTERPDRAGTRPRAKH
jgi:hypothetical protein